MHMYGHEYYGGNGIVGAQVTVNYIYCVLVILPLLRPVMRSEQQNTSYSVNTVLKRNKHKNFLPFQTHL